MDVVVETSNALSTILFLAYSLEQSFPDILYGFRSNHKALKNLAKNRALFSDFMNKVNSVPF